MMIRESLVCSGDKKLPIYDIFMNLKLRIEESVEKLRLLYNAFYVDSGLYIE